MSSFLFHTLTKLYRFFFKTITEFMFFIFEMLFLNIFIIQSIKNKKNHLSEIYIFKYKKIEK